MIHIVVLMFVALPLLKLVLVVAWPGLLRRLEGQRASATLIAQFGAIEENERVKSIGTRLLSGTNLTARFGVLQSPIRNAVALPNGHILLWQGLLDDTRNDDDMLAGVIAHELGHLQHGHFLERVQWAALARFIMGIFGGGWMRRLLQSMAATIVTRGYSRAQEHEADEAALRLMQGAGFNPSGLARLLEHLSSTMPDSGGGLMGTHPAASDRAARIRQRLNLPAAPPSKQPKQPKQRAPATPPDNVLRFPGRS